MGADDLHVRPGVVIPDSEISERFSSSGGPGGQHANRSYTRVELRFDIATSESLNEHHRERLVSVFGGEIRVVVDDERSQMRNRQLARERLAARLRSALTPSKIRRVTKATRSSQVRRMDAKRRRGQTKQLRRPPTADQ